MSQFVGFIPAGSKRPRIAPMPSTRPVVGKFGFRRRVRRGAVSRGGPPGTTKRYVARVVRDMPMYAPHAATKPEMMYFDVASATYAMDTTGTVTHINPIAPTDVLLSGRFGARVLTFGVQVRGIVTSGTTTGIARGTMAVIWDRNPFGALPAITDIYSAVSSGAFQVVTNRERFHILGRFDYLRIGNSTTPTVGREAEVVNVNIACKKPSTFAATGVSGAIATIVTGAIYLVTFGDTAAGTAAVTSTLLTRVYYGDN